MHWLYLFKISYKTHNPSDHSLKARLYSSDKPNVFLRKASVRMRLSLRFSSLRKPCPSPGRHEQASTEKAPKRTRQELLTVVKDRFYLTVTSLFDPFDDLVGWRKWA
jgi:hypothetical protein